MMVIMTMIMMMIIIIMSSRSLRLITQGFNLQRYVDMPSRKFRVGFVKVIFHYP